MKVLVRSATIVALLLAIILNTRHSASAETITVVAGFGSGVRLSMANIGGVPVIPYYDGNARILKVVKCGNIACNSGNIINTLDNVPDAGAPNEIINIGGLPVIAYHSSGGLKVIRCGDAACTPALTTVNTLASNIGGTLSIADIGGLPLIAYDDAVNHDLNVIRCGDVFCTPALATYNDVDGLGRNVGYYPFIANIGGLPLITYGDYTISLDGDLKVLRCGDVYCTPASNTIQVLDGVGNFGGYSSITEIAGLPVVAYLDQTNFDLKVAHCGDAACTPALATYNAVDSIGDVGVHTWITSSGGLPVISYYDQTNSALKIAFCGDVFCSPSLAKTKTLDSEGTTGGDGHLLFFSGVPVIAYHDETYGLKVYSDQMPTLVNSTGMKVNYRSANNIIGNAALLTTDPDNAGATLTYTVVTRPSQGMLNLGATFTQAQIDANGLMYTHTGTGSDYFTFTISDGVFTIGPYMFNITVSPPTNTPTATYTNSRTPTKTITPINTRTSTPTKPPTSIFTSTVAPTATRTPSFTPSPRSIPTNTSTPTRKPAYTPTQPSKVLPNGLTAYYYNNPDFTNLVFSRVESQVNYNWGSGSPDARIAPDTFSMRWIGKIMPKYSEAYVFYVNASDGVRLWVNGSLIIDSWVNRSGERTSIPIRLNASTKYDIRLDYYEDVGDAYISLSWSSAHQPKEIIQQRWLFRHMQQWW